MGNCFQLLGDLYVEKKKENKAIENFLLANNFYNKGNSNVSSEWACIQNNHAVCLLKYAELLSVGTELTKVARVKGKVKELLKERDFIMRNRTVSNETVAIEKMLWLTFEKNEHTCSAYEEQIKTTVSKHTFFHGKLLYKNPLNGEFEKIHFEIASVRSDHLHMLSRTESSSSISLPSLIPNQPSNVLQSIVQSPLYSQSESPLYSQSESPSSLSLATRSHSMQALKRKGSDLKEHLHHFNHPTHSLSDVSSHYPKKNILSFSTNKTGQHKTVLDLDTTKFNFSRIEVHHRKHCFCVYFEKIEFIFSADNKKQLQAIIDSISPFVTSSQDRFDSK